MAPAAPSFALLCLLDQNALVSQLPQLLLESEQGQSLAHHCFPKPRLSQQEN